MPLQRKPTLEDYYSKETAALAKKVEVDPEIVDGGPVDTDDDLLSDFDMTMLAEVESDAEIMAALDSPDSSDDVAEPDPVMPVADWLADVQELARKHGPFARWQIDQIIRALTALADEAGR